MGVTEKNGPAFDGAGMNVLEKLKTAAENVDQFARDPRSAVSDLAALAVDRATEFAADAVQETAEKLGTAAEQAVQALFARKDGRENVRESDENCLTDEDAASEAPEPEAEETGEPEAEQPAPAAEAFPVAPAPPVAPDKAAGNAPTPPVPAKSLPVFGVITAVLLAAVALLGVGGVAIALIDLNMFRGLEESAFVGVENFVRFFNSPYFPSTIRNSAFLRLIQIGAGLILALPLIAWVKMGKSAGKTLTKAFLCLAPYCLPYLVSAYAAVSALPREWIMGRNGGYLMYGLATVLQTAGFIGFCGGLFSYLKLRGVGNGARQGVCLALLISLLTVLTPDTGAILMVTNSMNRGTTMTLDYYAYTTAFMQNRLSLSSAVSVVKAAGQGLIGVFAAAMICKIAKKDESRIEIPDAKISLFTFSVTRLIWAGILLALVILAFGIDVVARQPQASAQALMGAAQSAAQDASTWNAAQVSAVVCALGGVLGGLAAYSFIAFFRSGRKGLGAAVWIAASSLTFLAAEYYAVFSLGLSNTVFPLILRQIVDPRLIGLMIVLAVALRMAPERRTKGILLGLIFFAMAFAWGDFFGSNLYATGSNTTLAGYFFRLTGLSVGREGISGEALLASRAQVPVYSLLVSLPALTLGFFGAASCIRGFKDAQ